MPRAVRHINETRILDTLFRSGSMSRADLGRVLGMTRSTAGSIVSALVEQGMVTEDQGEPTGRGSRTGRPGSDVQLNPGYAIFLGADIGVGRLAVVAIDFKADVVGRAARPFDLQAVTPETIVEDLVGLVGSLRADLRMSDAVQGLSVAVPGLLDHDGEVLRAPILGWAKVPILRMLQARLPDIPTILAENDANALAMAELYRGAGSASTEALYMFLDAGVGGGLVSNGALLRGQNGYAGEIGHVFVGDEGFASHATLPGSLESFVGREAILTRNRSCGGSARTLDEFIEALDLRTPSALATIADWCHYLGRGLATLTSVLDPEKIVLGGPVSVLFGRFERDVLASVRKHLLPGHPLPMVELSSLGMDGPAIGAASMLHRNMLAFDEDLVFNGIFTS